MEIRLGREHDHDGCVELDSLVIGSDARKEFLLLGLREKRIYVAARKGRIVGLITFEPDFFGCLYISLLMVHPDRRRRGIARELIEKVSAHSTDGRLFSSTEEDNEISLKMHEALGFRRSGYIENLPQPKREIILFKELDRGRKTLP